MDGGAWWAAVPGVAKSQTRLSDFTFTYHFHALEKETATHSSDLAWRIPGIGDPGGLLSMGSHRVGHDWSDLAAAAGSLVTRETSRGHAPHRPFDENNHQLGPGASTFLEGQPFAGWSRLWWARGCTQSKTTAIWVAWLCRTSLNIR